MRSVRNFFENLDINFKLYKNGFTVVQEESGFSQNKISVIKVDKNAPLPTFGPSKSSRIRITNKNFKFPLDDHFGITKDGVLGFGVKGGFTHKCSSIQFKSDYLSVISNNGRASSVLLGRYVGFNPHTEQLFWINEAVPKTWINYLITIIVAAVGFFVLPLIVSLISFEEGVPAIALPFSLLEIWESSRSWHTGLWLEFLACLHWLFYIHGVIVSCLLIGIVVTISKFKIFFIHLDFEIKSTAANMGIVFICASIFVVPIMFLTMLVKFFLYYLINLVPTIAFLFVMCVVEWYFFNKAFMVLLHFPYYFSIAGVVFELGLVISIVVIGLIEKRRKMKKRNA